MLVIACFAMLLAKTASEEAVKRLEVVTHHKTGTVFSFSIYNLLCFEPMLPMGNLEHYFLMQKNSRKLICDNVWMNLAGLYDVDFENIPQEPDPNVKYIHFIRHPVDMLISGYLYHFKCAEGWCEDPHAQWSEYLLPQTGFPVEGSYCAWLQSHSDEEGLEMELFRTLNSLDGLNNMMRAIKYLDHQDTLTICLSEAFDLVATMDATIAPWNKYNRLLDIVDDKAHHSSPKRELDLYPIALRLILTVIPEEVLLTFPCPSAFFDSFQTSKDWFQSQLGTPN